MSRAAFNSTFGGVSDFCFSIFEGEDLVRAEVDTAGLPSFGAAITFVGVDCGKPRSL